MTEVWTDSTVGEWCPFIYGKGLPERVRTGGPIPVYGSNGIVGWHNEHLVEPKGIIIGRKGTVGSVNFSAVPFWAIDTTFFVKDDPKRDLRFTAALLSSLGLEERNSHSAVPGLSREDAHSLNIKIPPLSIQQQVAKILIALDEQIDDLHQILETVGKTVIAACDVAISERSNNETISLPQATKLVNGGAFTKGASGEGRMVIRIKELNSGASESTIYNDISVPENKTAYPGDVLFAWSGSLGVWRWYEDEAIINQHIFKVLPAEHPVWLGWVHILRELENFQNIAAGKATTMGHITKDHLERTQVPALTRDELTNLTCLVEPLWDYQLCVGQQLITLKMLRDFLTPELVTGELVISEAVS